MRGSSPGSISKFTSFLLKLITWPWTTLIHKSLLVYKTDPTQTCLSVYQLLVIRSINRAIKITHACQELTSQSLLLICVTNIVCKFLCVNVLPWGPGKPFLGQPNGWPSVSSSVYSCSIPNQGFLALACSITSLHVFLWFVSNEKEQSKIFSSTYKYMYNLIYGKNKRTFSFKNSTREKNNFMQEFPSTHC